MEVKDDLSGSPSCGNANPKGNIQLIFKGGCGKTIKDGDEYRCVGCGGYFHKKCIIKHFELEKDHDYGRQQEKKKIIKVLDRLKFDRIEGIVKGLTLEQFNDRIDRAKEEVK